MQGQTDHAAEAEQWLDRAHGDPVYDDHVAYCTARAQAHATLAVAAELRAIREHGVYRTGDGA